MIKEQDNSQDGSISNEEQSSSYKRTLLFIHPDILIGIALAFELTGFIFLIKFAIENI